MWSRHTRFGWTIDGPASEVLAIHLHAVHGRMTALQALSQMFGEEYDIVLLPPQNDGLPDAGDVYEVRTKIESSTGAGPKKGQTKTVKRTAQ